jgi:hypothetical protein
VVSLHVIIMMPIPTLKISLSWGQGPRKVDLILK